MNYVVTSSRLRDYLFSLGLDYEQVNDKTGRQKFVWLFRNDEPLKEALTFYNTFKKAHIKTYN